MKIIITGANGIIGREALRQCLKNSFITHVFAMARSPLTDRKLAEHAKCTEIIHEDFEKWSESDLRFFREQGVRGCIWCIGGGVPKFKDLEEAERVNIAMPQAAVEAFSAHVAPTEDEVAAAPKRGRGIAFRFIYMSIFGAEQDQTRSLWSQAQTRKMKGAAEKQLFDFADSRVKGTFEVYALRLGTVLEGGQSAWNLMRESTSACVSDELVAKRAIKIVLDGRYDDEGGRILENNDVLGEDWAEINTQII